MFRKARKRLFLLDKMSASISNVKLSAFWQWLVINSNNSLQVIIYGIIYVLQWYLKPSLCVDKRYSSFRIWLQIIFTIVFFNLKWTTWLQLKISMRLNFRLFMITQWLFICLFLQEIAKLHNNTWCTIPCIPRMYLKIF